jgi:Ca2+-binding RTX toxin-like protein
MGRLLLIASILLALPAAVTAAPGAATDRLLFTQKGPAIGRYLNPGFVCASAPDGTRPVRVVELEAYSSWTDTFAVSADGSRLAFVIGGNLHVAAVDGTGARRIGLGSMPAWTPDGSAIVYGGPKGLQSIRPDGTGETVLAASGTGPAVSPDGRTVAFVRGDRLILIDSSGGAERVVLTRAGLASPDWAPDGSKIVLAVAGAVHSVRPDGTGLVALTNGTGDSEPAYSPDGTRIAFERGDDIWLMTASGGDLAVVMKTPLFEGAPDWQAAAAGAPAGTDRTCAIVGTEGPDELVGGEHQDFFYDLGGDDTIRGLGGDDYVFDGAGNDRIEGGAGRDSIILTAGSNVVHGGGGNDSIYGSGLYRCCIPVSAPQQLYGEDGNDYLTGGDAGDRIVGGAGNDVLNGLRGPDILVGGPGDDRLVGNRGDDSLDGGGGNDVLHGGLTSGRPFFYDGYDLLVGGGGDDRLEGGWQKDRLFGGPGNDDLSGGPNADYLKGEAGVGAHRGGAGDDLLLARDGRRETVDGGAGTDRARVDPSDRRVRVERRLP